MIHSELISNRYSGDQALLAELQADEVIAEQLSKINVDRHRNNVRAQLLSTAVRVESNLLPNITDAFDSVKTRAGLEEEMEAYVFEESSINAFVTKGRTHTMVGLSSGAVTKLSTAELEFVIGHEFGHTLFNHLDIYTSHLLQSDALNARQRMQLLAWQRSAEISADRCGLICCGSLEVAATGLFKTLCGLGGDIKICPADFADQWDHLVHEVITGADGEQWQMTHPFPPLRMKAMMEFWEANESQEDDRDRAPSDKAIERLLAMMDPLARENPDAVDPVLQNFFLWGGLYLALANGEFHEEERSQLESITSPAILEQAFADGVPTADDCLQKFSENHEGWTRKLTTLEVHRVIQGLLQIAYADGHIDESETEAFKKIGAVLRLTDHACDSMIAKYNDTGGVS
ncbi:M48 family metalloprotease [Arenicellales bacterium IMCC57338]